MAEEETVVEEQEQDIWAMLGIENPDEATPPYEAEEEEAEAEAEKEDKLAKKLTARMDSMQKKFDTTTLQNAKDKFLANAGPLEKDLFKTVSADIKDMTTLARMAEMVREKAKGMQSTIDGFEVEAKLEAAAKARTAWGITGTPVGGHLDPTDEEKELLDANSKGDYRASAKLLFGDDKMLGGLFS